MYDRVKAKKPFRKPIQADSTPTITSAWLMFIPVSIAFICVTTLYCIRFSNGFSSKQDIWAQFGDYFGGVLGPIIGLMALVGAWFAYKVQFEANSQASRQFKGQNQASTFFELLKLHLQKVESFAYRETRGRSAIESLIGKYKELTYNVLEKLAIQELINTKRISDTYRGRLQLSVLRNSRILDHGIYKPMSEVHSDERIAQMIEGMNAIQLRDFLEMQFSVSDSNSKRELCEEFVRNLPTKEMLMLHLEVDEAIYNECGNEIGHYFRNLSYSLSFISTCGDQEDEYRRIFRAQLSKSEIALLAYNCVSDRTSISFNDLVVAYNLFDDLDESDLWIPSSYNKLLNSANALMQHVEEV